MIGAVKYYNENCAGLNTAGYRKMNQGLKLRLYLVDRNIKQAHLSLSDEKFNAVAFVVLELGEKNEAEKDESGTTF
jgi:holo-[acyl-carrier protein] synthase